MKEEEGGRGEVKEGVEVYDEGVGGVEKEEGEVYWTEVKVGGLPVYMTEE